MKKPKPKPLTLEREVAEAIEYAMEIGRNPARVAIRLMRRRMKSKDTERLDWLQKTAETVFAECGQFKIWSPRKEPLKMCQRHDIAYNENLRQAIDAAMRQERGR